MTVPVALDAVKDTEALPLASVYLAKLVNAVSTRPPFVVVTVKETDTPAMGAPEELVTITSKAWEARLPGETIWPLPPEILMEEPDPTTPMDSLKVALPAVDVARITTVPR